MVETNNNNNNNKNNSKNNNNNYNNVIILPPPSERNPIPSLSAALRVDNREQLVALLVPETDSARQSLIFGSESMRTLLLRLVLVDPHQPLSLSSSSSSSQQHQQQQQKWDDASTFPRLASHWNVVDTSILTDFLASTATKATADVYTYFLRPSDLRQTQRAVDAILHHSKQNSRGTQNQQQKKQNVQQQYRLVYVPQTPAMVYKLLANVGLLTNNNQSSVGNHNNNINNSSNSTSSPGVMVSVHSLQLDLFPIEPDVLSMEFPDAFAELHLHGTPSTVIADAARSILKLQDIVGTIPRIQTYGVAAEQVLRKTMDLAVSEHDNNNNTSSSGATNNDEAELRSAASESGVAALILLDRAVDMVTPLVTALTYECLLDDVVGIESGILTVQADILNPPSSDPTEFLPNQQQQSSNKANATTKAPSLVTLPVNESDTLFGDIRNQHVEQFGSYLQNQAKAMQATQNDFKETGKHKELSELHKFVKQLPGFKQKFQSLSTHIYLAELVKGTSEDAAFRERWQMERTMLEGDGCLDELDDLVAMSYPPYRFLRLMCLQSICKNGINSSRYDSLRKDVVQTYGYEFLALLINLEKTGLLRRKEAFLGMEKPSSFSKLKNSLILINAEVDTVEPDDISYISSGYAPLSVRLLQSAVTGWKNGRDDILRELPGRCLDILQEYPPQDLATTLQRQQHRSTANGSLSIPLAYPLGAGTSRKKPVLVVLYLGGVTYMEIAALRFLSKRQNFPYHIICCTTKIINGSTLLQSLH